jgi:LmbE family N-acetylglucosaminyl deacetylase
MLSLDRKSTAKKLRVLAVGPHPDDIEIGCAGTLIKLAKAGHQVSLAIMTDGGAGGDPRVRRREAEAAAKLYKARRIHWLGYPDTTVPVDNESIGRLEDVLKAVRPDIVFANAGQDTHQDHRNTASIVLSATRNAHNVLFYEVPSTVDFQPDVFVDISRELPAKFRALRLHKSQLKKGNVGAHAILECASTMATFRGFHARIQAAEGFKALRLLLRF